MKIKLDRKLISCPDSLRCTVCRQTFKVNRIRTLLYNDRGLIQGDICPKCMKLKAQEIKQKIGEQAMLLMELPELCSSTTISAQERALELLECATENVKFPTFYQWLMKKIEIAAPKSGQVEATGLIPYCRISKRSPWQILFENKDEQR